MCGRYAFTHSLDDLRALFGPLEVGDLASDPRYNVAPTQSVPVVYLDEQGNRRIDTARWGLVPGWVKSPSDWKASTFNARSEDVANKPAFRNAFRRGRVLIPASGFFEWRREGARKQPYYIRRKDGRPLAFAGLMDVWRDQSDDERLVSCTILTTSSRGAIQELHHRMPLFIAADDFQEWLATSEPAVTLERLRDEVPVDDLELYPVTPAVNDARNEDPSFVRPLS